MSENEQDNESFSDSCILILYCISYIDIDTNEEEIQSNQQEELFLLHME